MNIKKCVSAQNKMAELAFSIDKTGVFETNEAETNQIHRQQHYIYPYKGTDWSDKIPQHSLVFLATDPKHTFKLANDITVAMEHCLTGAMVNIDSYMFAQEAMLHYARLRSRSHPTELNHMFGFDYTSLLSCNRPGGGFEYAGAMETVPVIRHDRRSHSGVTERDVQIRTQGQTYVTNYTRSFGIGTWHMWILEELAFVGCDDMESRFSFGVNPSPQPVVGAWDQLIPSKYRYVAKNRILVTRTPYCPIEALQYEVKQFGPNGSPEESLVLESVPRYVGLIKANKKGDPLKSNDKSIKFMKFPMDDESASFINTIEMYLYPKI